MFKYLKLMACVVFAVAATPTLAAAKSPGTFEQLHASEPPVAAGVSRVYFYRDTSFGGLIQPAIKINGVKTGYDSGPNDYFYMDLPPGPYLVESATEADHKAMVDVLPGEPLYIRFIVTPGFFVAHIWPILVPAEKAVNQIKDCDFVVPPADLVIPQPQSYPGASSAPPAPAPTTPPAETPATPPPTQAK